MSRAVAQRLEKLRSESGLSWYDDGWELLEVLKRGKKPRLAKTNYGVTLTHYASKYGWLDFVKFLIEEHHCQSNARTDAGETPLYYACRHGRFHIICYLVNEQHCDPHYGDDDKIRTPFRCLIDSSKLCTNEQALVIVKFLVSSAKCDINLKDKYGSTILHVACRVGFSGFVRCFIASERCDVTIENSNGDTALHVACQSNLSDEITKALLEKTEINLNAKNKHGDTPLHLACRKAKGTQALVSDHRCNPHEKNNDGDTALHIACSSSVDKGSALEISKLLLEEAKLDPSAKNNNGDTPLHLACKNKNYTFVQALVKDERCNPNVKNNSGDTALHVACQHNGPYDILKILLEMANVDPNVKNNNGDTPLYLASKNGGFKLAQLLVEHERCNPHERNSNGDTALHVACCENITELLLEEAKIDPNAKDNDGKTPLHFACKNSRNPSVAKLLVRDKRCNLTEKDKSGNTPLVLHWACECKDPEFVSLLIKDERCDLHEKNSVGDSALHFTSGLYATSSPHVSTNPLLEVSKILLEEGKFDQNAKDSNGNTALHIACRSIKKNSKLVQLLVQEERCNPHEQNSEGDTALHVACYSNHSGAIVKCLLEETKSGLTVKNIDGKTPLDIAVHPDVIRELIRHGANPQDVYKTHGKILGKHSSNQPLQTPVKLFMVGNPSAGKSTLTKALKEEAFGFGRITKRFIKVTGVDTKTAGIVPHEFESKIYGQVTLYDFAGQREFYGSHAALLQNAIQTSTPVFLVVLDLNESNENLKQNLFYWLSFLENQCTSVSRKPHFVVIGSHADIMKLRGEDPNQKAHFITSLIIRDTFPSLEFTTLIAMDCQYADSTGMTELHKALKTSCDSLRIQESIDFNAHCFLVYLLDKFREATALTLATIQAQIETDSKQVKTSEDDIKSFVPSNIDSLATICDQLNDRGHLLVLKNPTAVENSWIIINRTALLAEVNGTIFAPEGFKEHIKLASSTGVVPLSNIAKHFPKHDLDMLVGFLSHLEFCHEVSDSEILGLINQEQVSTASEATNVQERYFFFPGLITLEVPNAVWEPQPQFDYHSGWILEFTVLGQFFYPRFVQVLLLRLAFLFAFAQEAWCVQEDIPTLQRKCSVWKSGIYWSDIHGIETLVEIAKQNRVAVLMRCPQVKSECFHLRSLLIQKVLVAAREFCNKVSTVEMFISPSDTTQYPLKPTSQLNCFSIDNIASVISKGAQSASVQDNTGKPNSLNSLLTFEPYADLEKVLLYKLFQEDPSDCNKIVSKEIISGMSSSISSKLQVFQSLFNIDPFQLEEALSHQYASSPLYRARQVLMIWRDSCEGTYKCLREKLDQFSIFAGRNLLEIAGVSSENNPQPIEDSVAIISYSAQAVELAVSPADVDMLAELLSEVVAHWDLVLGQVGLPSHIRDEIRNDNSNKAKFSKRCLLEGLRRWVESEDRPTYGRITAALRGSSVCNETLARRVEEFAESRLGVLPLGTYEDGESDD